MHICMLCLCPGSSACTNFLRLSFQSVCVWLIEDFVLISKNSYPKLRTSIMLELENALETNVWRLRYPLIIFLTVESSLEKCLVPFL